MSIETNLLSIHVNLLSIDYPSKSIKKMPQKFVCTIGYHRNNYIIGSSIGGLYMGVGNCESRTPPYLDNSALKLWCSLFSGPSPVVWSLGNLSYSVLLRLKNTSGNWLAPTSRRNLDRWAKEAHQRLASSAWKTGESWLMIYSQKIMRQMPVQVVILEVAQL